MTIRTIHALLVFCVGCGATETPSGDVESGGDEAPVEVGSNGEEETTTMITLRFELANDTIPAGADTSTNVEARITGSLYARNESGTAIDLEFRAFAAHDLDWLLTRSDGVTFQPVFLPPPMPLPGGPPARSLHLEPNTETAFATLNGISGFFEETRGPETWGPLPVGTYEVVIRGIELGTGPLATEPFNLVVR